MKPRFYWAIMRKLGLLFVGLAVIGCEDPAKAGYTICEALQKDGKLDDARDACHRAATASPTSNYGIKAIQKIDQLTAKIDSIIPATVSIEWCARLSARLQPKLSSEAQAKFPGRDPGVVAQSVKEHVENMEYNCRQDVGKPTTGEWACRWNETYETAKECDKLAAGK